MQDILTQVQIIFVRLAGYFTSILSSTRLEIIYVYGVFVVLVVRFVLMPIFGGGGFGGRSDTAKKTKDGDTND